MKNGRIFHGWWIVAACFICVFTYSGVGYYSFSLFWEAFIDDPQFGWSMGELTRSFSIVYGVIALSSPFAGRIIDRYGPSRTIAVGAVIVGTGFVLLSFTKSLLHFYLCYALIGVGMAGSGFMPASTVISNWFSKRRGLALGITMTGIGAGGFVLAPIIGNIIIPNLGWSSAYLVLAIIIWSVMIPLALLVIKAKPQDMALHPDGVESAELVVPPRSAVLKDRSWTRGMAMRSIPFWLIAIAFSASSFGNTGIVQNQTRYLNDVYRTAPDISAYLPTILGTVGIGSTAGKLLFGWLTDKIGPRLCSIICISFSIGAVLMLMNVDSSTQPPVLWIYAIMLGLSMGGWASNTPMLVSAGFGLKHYGAIFGAINMPIMMSTALGPYIAGAVYDIYGSYSTVFIYSLILASAAILGMILYRSPKWKLSANSV